MATTDYVFKKSCCEQEQKPGGQQLEGTVRASKNRATTHVLRLMSMFQDCGGLWRQSRGEAPPPIWAGPELRFNQRQVEESTLCELLAKPSGDL